jgi:1,4-alpha-glucan branching enzyme
MTEQGMDGHKKITFQLKAEHGRKVCVSGSFNGWKPDEYPLASRDGHYRRKLTLPKGRHEYKFVIDGHWVPDPNCADTVPDGCGGRNSVLTVD